MCGQARLQPVMQSSTAAQRSTAAELREERCVQECLMGAASASNGLLLLLLLWLLPWQVLLHSPARPGRGWCCCCHDCCS
jgi:hypothetical protein